MTFKRIPEMNSIVCDHCGESKETTQNNLPTYWAQVDIIHHEDWAGGKSTKHYCDKCYSKMKITFGDEK